MKVLIVGDFYAKIYEEAFYLGFKELGHEVLFFKWGLYYKYLYFNKNNVKSFKDYWLLLQNKLRIGPEIKNINNDLIDFAKQEKPDLVFIYRGTHIYRKTIDKIKKIDIKVFGYNNDDPFSDKYPFYFWHHYLKALKSYDYLFAYREKNIDEYKQLKISNVELLRAYYIDKYNFIIEKKETIEQEYKNDVIFIGHFENDGRDILIKYLIQNGINVKIYGPNWESSREYNFIIDRVGEIKPIYKEYNTVINGAQIALVFLSKQNNDTYTRRCFEIPASGTMMMCEYTEDLNSMFKEDVEAVYFRDKYELLEKIIYYLGHKTELNRIAMNGYNRVHKDGHEVKDRINQVVKIYNRMYD